MAGEKAVFYVEEGLHGFVVGDALGVVALHDATNLGWCLYGFLFYNLIVTDDAEDDFRSHYGII